MVCAVLFLHMAWPYQSFGQAKGEIDPEAEGMPDQPAPIEIDGRELFKVYAIASFREDQRAEGIEKRIRKALADAAITDTSVKVMAGEDRMVITAGSEFIMNVYDGDGQKNGVSKTVLAEFYAQKIRHAIKAYHADRSRPVVIRQVVHAAIATAIAIVVVLILMWLVRRGRNWIRQRIQTKIDSLEDKSFKLIRSGQLWKAFQLLFRLIRIVLIIVIIAAYIQYILGLFPWTKGLSAYIFRLFLEPLQKLGTGFIGFLPSLAFLVVIYFVTRYLLKLVRLLFTGIKDGGIRISGFDPDWALATFKIVRLVVIVFAFVIAFPYIPGSDTDAFKGISVFVGVLFSLGSSSFISNIIAGYSMTYRGAFKKGDRIQVDGTVGIVEEQKLMITKLRSLKNEEIVIPNSVILNSNIINYSSRSKDLGLILHTTVGIGYETPWRLVDAMLKEAATRTQGLLTQPAPFVLQQALGDFAVTYELNVYCDDAQRIPQFYTALHQNILDVFNENNVQIMTPAYEGDPEIPKVVPKDQWNTPLAKDHPGTK